ncbi:nuclear respiratory factor 1 isoform X1 [Cavia porcellus]|uniref:nuclear respiratory factor 1 isoform X1 n=1 Tax=Cavia porcellus TaxID=10141 RepID=UPI002FE30CCF
MEEHGVTQTEHMATIEAHAVAQQVQQVHVATYTEHSMLSADEDSPSSPEDTSYDDSDILNSTAADEVTAHLAAAGPVGMAAAAAVATGKKRKRPHVFESNPSIRKRQQTRLLRKLRATLDEYTTRVGQQAIVLCISPSKPNPVFKVFGAAPLENVVRKYKSMILEDLESALAEHAPAPQEVNSELPPLTIDGIPVSVDKMTQAQLRAFIPEMLKYSTGRGKPGWGKESCKPIWWPEDIPWANVRSDVRTEEQKQRVSWTQALRTIVKNCYKQHGREDLLYAFEDQQTQTQATTTHSIAHLVPSQTVVQTFSNPDGTVSLIQVGTGATVATLADASELPTTVTVAQVNYSAVADGEVEQNWATLQGGEMTIQTTQASEATQAVASLAEAAVAASQEMQQGATVTMALNSEAAAHAVATLAEATLQGGGQIVLSGETAAAVGALTGVQDANAGSWSQWPRTGLPGEVPQKSGSQRRTVPDLPGPDPSEHVPDCGNQPRPGQRPSTGGHGPCDHQDIRQRSHHGRPGCGGGNIGTVTHSHTMASFSSLLQNFLHVLQRCNQMELSLLTLEEKFC